MYTHTLFIKQAGSAADKLRVIRVVVPRYTLVEMREAISFEG